MAGPAFLKTSSQVNFSAPWNLSLQLPCGENAGDFGKALRSSSFNSTIWALIASRPWTVRRKVASDTSSVSKWTGSLFFFSLFLEVCMALLRLFFLFGWVNALRAFWALCAIAFFRDRPFAPRVIVGATFHCFISGILPRTSALSGVRITLTSPDPSSGWWPHWRKALLQFNKKESKILSKNPKRYNRMCKAAYPTKWCASLNWHLTIITILISREMAIPLTTEWYALICLTTRWYSSGISRTHQHSKCIQMHPQMHTHAYECAYCCQNTLFHIQNAHQCFHPNSPSCRGSTAKPFSGAILRSRSNFIFSELFSLTFSSHWSTPSILHHL